MQQQIVKCEFLWTRFCPIKCEYCAMVDGRRNTMTLEEIKSGIDNLKQLGCSFIAICGAECLADFNKLPETVNYIESSGIHSTVITSGVVRDFYKKLDILYENKLRSLTMSYDIVPLDRWSGIKSGRAIDGLKYFQKLGDYRDTAVIVTLTRKNYTSLLDTIKYMTSENIWTFFDFIHPDRGQPGSKCKNVDKSLIFTEEDYPKLTEVLEGVLDLKKRGYLCHSSTRFIKMVERYNFDLIRNYNWNCAYEFDFPAWVTWDGPSNLVYCCDDYEPKAIKFYSNKLVEEWDNFVNYWENNIKEQCPGCCWSHHIDAHLVKRGVLNLSDYVHGIE